MTSESDVSLLCRARLAERVRQSSNITAAAAAQRRQPSNVQKETSCKATANHLPAQFPLSASFVVSHIVSMHLSDRQGTHLRGMTVILIRCVPVSPLCSSGC